MGKKSLILRQRFAVLSQRLINDSPTIGQVLAGIGFCVRRIDMQSFAQDLANSSITLQSYDRIADEYKGWTKDRDLAADYEWFMSFVRGTGPFNLLDLGCGPGRDLLRLRQLGHRAVGLDGSLAMVRLARSFSGCPVLHQNFLSLRLRPGRFDGIFASASLFHVPPDALPEVLQRLHTALRAEGVLYTLNPRGRGQSGWAGDRYCTYYSRKAWRRLLVGAGFRERGCELRPLGVEPGSQNWLAFVWQTR